VRHPNVVELLDAYEGKASFTIITELLEGALVVSVCGSIFAVSY